MESFTNLPFEIVKFTKHKFSLYLLKIFIQKVPKCAALLNKFLLFVI